MVLKLLGSVKKAVAPLSPPHPKTPTLEGGSWAPSHLPVNPQGGQV